MAKHCNRCNQDYADDLPACPHCAAAKKTQPAYLHPLPKSESRSSDSAVNLGGAPPASSDSGNEHHPQPSSPSGSSVEWAAPPEQPPGEPVLLESPSDATLAQETASAKLGSKPSGSPSDSAVDLGASVEIIEETTPPLSDIIAAELAGDASKVDLVGDERRAGSASDSATPPPVEGTSRGEVQAASPESGVDVIEEADLEAAEEDEHSSAVDLGAVRPPSSDVIPAMGAEASADVGSSGVDLEGLPVPMVPSSASGSGSGRHGSSESSVDLGSQEDVPSPGMTGEEEPAVSDAEVDRLLAEVDEDSTAEGVSAAAEEEEEIRDRERAETEAESALSQSRSGRPRSRAPALIGTTLLGVVLGAGGLIGARLGGVDVPAAMGIGGKTSPSAAGPAATTTQTQTQSQVPNFATRLGFVRSGDFDAAAKAGIEQIQESNPEELAARGSYRLGAYLQKTGKVNPQDDQLKLAIADLQKAAEAKNPDAIYDLGLIQELANKLAEARAEYTKGKDQFQSDPVQKRRFEAALDRLDLKEAVGAAGAFLAPQPDRAAFMALLLIGLQEVQPPAAAAQAVADEAGFDFWKAAKAARSHKYAEAVKNIEAARKQHDSRRFTRLRKSQNPLSDPTEDIFLRCCDELKAYWQLQDRLRGGGYLTDKNTPSQALDAALKDAKGGGATAAKALADAKERMEKLTGEKKAADDKVAELTTQLKKVTDDSAAATTKLKKAEDALKERDALLKTASDSERRLKSANESLTGSLKKIADELETAKLIDRGSNADIAEAVHQTIAIAAMKDPRGEIRKLRMEVNRAAAALRQRRRPQEMIPLWLLILEQNRERSELEQKVTAQEVLRDVQQVKADPSATKGERGRADIVKGLALRNAGEFVAAKAALEAGRTAVDQGGWLFLANDALREVSDPGKYYADRAEVLYSRGQREALLALFNQALRVLPAKERAGLLARRSLIELDAARSKHRGALPPSEPLLAAARRDAEEAAKADIAEGHYAAGKIAEALGRWDAATASYRKALAAHPAADAEGSRYRIALARALMQPSSPRSAPMILPPPGAKVGRRDSLRQLPTELLVVTALIGLQAPLLPEEPPGVAEAEKLADEILGAPANTVPFNVRAQALAIKGRWTLALRLYVDGLRPSLPRERADGLLYLILHHPCLRRPDSLRVPDPIEAEKHFAAGVNFYFEGDYADAEKDLLIAIENDSQDARYFYFLGLSHLALNRRLDALADFEEGAILERLSRPSSRAVSQTLERVQGKKRRILNEVRGRPER